MRLGALRGGEVEGTFSVFAPEALSLLEYESDLRSSASAAPQMGPTHSFPPSPLPFICLSIYPRDFLPSRSSLPSLLICLHLSVDRSFYLLDFPPSFPSICPGGCPSISWIFLPPSCHLPPSLPTPVKVIRGRIPPSASPPYLCASFTLLNPIIFLFCRCLLLIFSLVSSLS